MERTVVIFDLDGTLLDTLGDLAASVNHALGKEKLPHRSLEEIRGFVGNGIDLLLKRSAPEECPEETLKRLHTHFKEHYALHAADTTLPYPGIIPVLLELHEKGCGLAVVSNKKDPAVKALCRKLLPPVFDAVHGEEDGIPRKPAPDMLFSVMQDLNAKPAQCIYVGDSEVDILTARNARIPCLSALWGFRSKKRLLSAGAQKILDTPQDILEFFSKKDSQAPQ